MNMYTYSDTSTLLLDSTLLVPVSLASFNCVNETMRNHMESQEKKNGILCTYSPFVCSFFVVTLIAHLETLLSVGQWGNKQKNM